MNTETLATCSAILFACSCLIAAPPATAEGDGVDQAWVDLFNGEDNGEFENDFAQAIALDSSGHIYVTGFSYEQVESNLFSPRYVTIKYSPDGIREWVRFYRNSRFDSAAFVNGVDSKDDLVVSGEFFLGQDWATLKYDSDGNVIWTRIYDANSTFVSNPEAMAIDAADNIYITGDVGSSINPDFGALVKYNSAGNQQWVAEYYGPEFNGGGSDDVAPDDSGNVYLAGYGIVSGRSGQAAIVKYDSNGNLVWQQTDGSRFQSAFDQFSDVAVDRDGNIVVAGTFGFNTSAGPDVAVSKYDPAGNLIWSREYDGGFGDDVGTVLAIDSNNNMIVGGSTENSAGDDDELVLKYDSDGTLLWAFSQGGDGLGRDFIRNITLDSADNIYYTGTEEPFSGVDFQVTARLDADGTLVWKELYGGPTEGGTTGVAVAISPDRDVYVTGDTFVPGNDDDIATIKYEQTSAGGHAELIMLEVVTGTLLDGELSDLEMADDSYVHTRSGFGEAIADLHKMEMIVNAVTTVDSPSTLDLSVEARIDQASGVARLFLRNRNTGEFEQVAQYSIGMAEEVFTIEDIDAMNYVGAGGEIDLMIKHNVFRPFIAFTFDSFFDEVRVEVR